MDVQVRDGENLLDVAADGLAVSLDSAQTIPADTRDRSFDDGPHLGTLGRVQELMAIVTQPNRARQLHGLRIPALVIHGDSDRMVHVSGGRATARAIPGAELILVRGMGHDMPAEHYDTIADGVRRTADRARSPEKQGAADPAR